MQPLTTGTLAGTGSFRCESCDYAVALTAADELPACPACGGTSFVRASIFATSQLATDPSPEPDPHTDAWLEEASEKITDPGPHLVYEDRGEVVARPLSDEWTRIGRSLAADIHFDDPTVSRRHALIVRQPDGLRVLDDRSLNGVYVNGERVEWSPLAPGDEIVIGRHRLHVVELDPAEAIEDEDAAGPEALLPG